MLLQRVLNFTKPMIHKTMNHHQHNSMNNQNKMTMAAAVLATGISVGMVASVRNKGEATTTAECKEEEAKNIALSPTEFRRFPLISKQAISPNTNVYRFAFPTPEHESGLTVSSCVVAKTEVDGKAITRPYTPVTVNHQKGYMDFIIKTYPSPGGVMSRHFADLPLGGTIEMKGPFPKLAYKPNMKKDIGMIAGGTGITPMLQIIREILANPADETKIHLVFANVTESDILLREELDALAHIYPQFKVYYTLDKPPKGWKGGAGFISEDMIRLHLPKANNDALILVCGPKGMLELVSGPKGANNTQGELDGLLKKCGFVSEQVFKY